MILLSGSLRDLRLGRKGERDLLNKGDFTADFRLVWLAVLAIPVGALCALVALVLQRLIGLFTNLFYYHSLRIPTELIAPPTTASGWAALGMIFVPVVGGLIIGLMARYGSGPSAATASRRRWKQSSSARAGCCRGSPCSNPFPRLSPSARAARSVPKVRSS